jgi:hypothetical protein
VIPGEADRHHEIENAILETVLYSDLFEYPLTYNEIAHYLVGVEAGVETICACLQSTGYLDGQLTEVDGYIVARQREELIARRRARQTASAQLWTRARRFVRVLAAMPFVRMVAITGALAMDNSAVGDDIDVMIVSARGRVWTTRMLAVGLVYIGKLFGDTLCPNYVVTEDAVVLDERTLFTAHEYAQMAPLYGLEVYQKMCQANDWVRDYLPNAREPFKQESEIRSGPLGRAVKRLAESLLGGRLGDAVERWEMRRKLRKFLPKVDSTSSAILDQDHVKGHFDDYGRPVMNLYAERLAEFQRVKSEV